MNQLLKFRCSWLRDVRMLNKSYWLLKGLFIFGDLRRLVRNELLGLSTNLMKRSICHNLFCHLFNFWNSHLLIWAWFVNIWSKSSFRNITFHIPARSYNRNIFWFSVILIVVVLTRKRHFYRVWKGRIHQLLILWLEIIWAHHANHRLLFTNETS